MKFDNNQSLKQTKNTFFTKVTTLADQQKRYKIFKKLKSQNVEQFREININQFNFNITENFEQLEYIDDVVTPLIYCAHFGLKQIIRLIVKNNNIDIDLETPVNKQTPLLVACICGNYEIARILIVAGAQVNKPNAMNQHPLTVTLFRLVEQAPTFQNKKICLKIAEVLVMHGADTNWIIDKAKGHSLLHYFCGSKAKLNSAQKMLNYEIIKFLLQNGADWSMKSFEDATPEDLLENHCNKEELKSLFMKEKERLKKLK